MAIENAENFAILLEDDTVVLRCERVLGNLVMTHDSAKYPLEEFRKNYPNVEIRNFSEDEELNVRKVPVAKLPNLLMGLKDRDLIRKFMAEDPRNTAKQHYIKRLEALGDLDGDAGSAD
jgi:hypothetical protein